MKGGDYNSKLKSKQASEWVCVSEWASEYVSERVSSTAKIVVN